MRLLLTGGYGCIGSWIVRQVVDKAGEVWIYDLKQDTHRLDLLMSPDEMKRVHFVAGDVTDASKVVQLCETEKLSHIVHLAGLQVPVCRANPILGANVNVIGTLAILEAARTLADQIKGVVYASSAAVFSPPSAYETGALSDDVPLNPSTHYGAFKVCNESNARVYWHDHGVASIGLRPWTVYGVGRDFGLTSDPTKAIKAAVVARPFEIKYGGLQDLQYVEDVAATFLRCVESEYQGAAVFNLRGVVASIEEFCKTLSEVVPGASDLVSHRADQIPIAYDLSDQALRREIGDIPLTSLRDGISKTAHLFSRLHGESRLDLSEL